MEIAGASAGAYKEKNYARYANAKEEKAAKERYFNEIITYKKVYTCTQNCLFSSNKFFYQHHALHVCVTGATHRLMIFLNPSYLRDIQ